MMNFFKNSRLAALSLVLGGALLMAAPLRAAQAEAPDELIRKLSVNVIDKIKADKDIQGGNPKKVSEFVDTTIMPSVNFERMTSLAVGRGWREANPEQQRRLIAEFRILLLRTYSGALGQVTDQTVRLKPLRADPSDEDVIVRSELVSRRGPPIQLDYRMQKIGTAWKIYDVNVLGVWLVETYRNQFSQELNNGGVDGLLKSLSDKNKQYAQG